MESRNPDQKNCIELVEGEGISTATNITSKKAERREFVANTRVY